ncbi:hypothetical protein STPYR_11401 [uncultured Stenotrophomonas sp.]|uniref:Uncharacterized protein n=1 Tax=uncultured Stenotrophomonas sp. TaxID=165438 RepID=A0A1Y5Q2I6_9GAMM|nr:hypothetical protein STPYR_11401 [uncultured Stenotrophomonas sp.]
MRNACWPVSTTTKASAGRTCPCARRSSSMPTRNAACCGCCVGVTSRPGKATSRAVGSSTTNWPPPLRARRRPTTTPCCACSSVSPRPRASSRRRYGRPSRPRCPTRTRRRNPCPPPTPTRPRSNACRMPWPGTAANSACPTACLLRASTWKPCCRTATGPHRWPAGAGNNLNRCYAPSWRNRKARARIRRPHGAIAQLGERRVRNAKVGSSILPGSTISRPKRRIERCGVFVCATVGKFLRFFPCRIRQTSVSCASSPAATPRKQSGSVAQLVEQGIENPRVGGSIPSRATTRFKGLQKCKPFLFARLLARRNIERKLHTAACGFA